MINQKYIVYRYFKENLTENSVILTVVGINRISHEAVVVGQRVPRGRTRT